MSEYGLSADATALLGKVRGLFGADKVRVTSGRGSRVGVAGGSSTSQHPSGNAFDFHVSGMSPAQVQAAITSSGIPFGQSIQEYGAAAGAGLNHLGVGTKGQIMVAHNGKYKTTGFAKPLQDGRNLLNIGLRSLPGGDAIADGLFGAGAILATPGDAIDAAVSDPLGALTGSGWFQRISLGLLALLLIGVALFMLAGKSVPQIVGKVSA